MIELGDLAETKLYLIRFNSLLLRHSLRAEAIYELLSALLLLNVLKKLLTVISLGLAVSAQ